MIAWLWIERERKVYLMESMMLITLFWASKLQEKDLIACLVSYTVVKVLQLMGNILAKIFSNCWVKFYSIISPRLGT